jgi:hypothetical protein
VFTWSWKASPAHRALLAEEQEARQRMRALALVQLLPDAASVRGVVQEAERITKPAAYNPNQPK